jgi:hypothetical protein
LVVTFFEAATDHWQSAPAHVVRAQAQHPGFPSRATCFRFTTGHPDESEIVARKRP